MTIKQIYNELCYTQSDINEHLPTLYQLALECETIVELGVRWVTSSWAFALANPKKLFCVDISKHKMVDYFLAICKNEQINVEFTECDSRTFDIKEDVDMIFFDTLHDYDQLKSELTHLGNRSKKYLVFHDTVTFGRVNETEAKTTEKPGLIPAIKEFLVQNEHWKEKHTYLNNNGLTILMRLN